MPVKCVYIGAVSLKDTFIREFCEWVIGQQGQVLFDVYAYNIPRDTVDYLENLESEFVRFFDKGVEYDGMPDLLRRYQVGLILYRGNTLNYVFNAPNKLFEYLVCGLDVWFPKEMKGIYPYERNDLLPKVIRIDFIKMSSFDLGRAMDRNGLPWKVDEYCCEDVFVELERALD